jgi:hypothetical protein
MSKESSEKMDYEITAHGDVVDFLEKLKSKKRV